jgi:DNA-binding SARP family transcriptional activator
LNLGGRKQRILLSMLACNANEAITTDRLIEALWGSAPPRSAQKNLRVYVYHLRGILGSDRRITWRAPGYALTVRPGELDFDLFEDLATAGIQALARNSLAEGAGLLRGALDLWRGPAMAGLLDVEPLRARAVRMEERRLDVLEKRITAEIALGRHADLIGELRALAAEHPLREHVQAQLMIALYRSGRRAEALEVYRTVRRTLVDELGVEPGAELQQLHQGVLLDDTAACDAIFPVAAEVQAHRADADELAQIRKALALIGLLLDRIEAPRRHDST